MRKTKLFNYDRIFNDSIHSPLINLIKIWRKNKVMNILYSRFCRSTVEFRNLAELGTSPSCSEQSNLNAPDVVNTTSKLINMNFPGRLSVSVGNTGTQQRNSLCSMMIFMYCWHCKVGYVLIRAAQLGKNKCYCRFLHLRMGKLL